MKKILLLMVLVSFCYAQKTASLPTKYIQDTPEFKTVNGHILATTDSIKTQSKINSITGKTEITDFIVYDTVDTEKSTDSTKIVFYKENYYYVINTSGKTINYKGSFDKRYAKAFKIDYILNKGKRPANAIKSKTAGTYTVTLNKNDTLDPGYTLKPLALGAAFGYEWKGDSLYNHSFDTSGMAHLWTCNTADTLNDSLNDSGNVGGKRGAFNTCTLVNNGKHKQALKFDGNDTLNLGVIPELSAVTAYTLSFWINLDTVNNYAHWYGTGVGGSFEIYSYSDGTLYGRVDGTGTFYFSLANYATLTPINKWHHIMLRYNGAGSTNAARCKLFINGKDPVLGYANTCPAITNTITAPLYFGNVTGGTQWLRGKIDGIRIYSKAVAATFSTTTIPTMVSADTAKGKERWTRRDTTTNMFAYCDTSRNTNGVDSIYFMNKPASLVVKHKVSANRIYDISTVLTPETTYQDSGYDSTITADSVVVVFRDSLIQNSTDTIRVIPVNNISGDDSSKYIVDLDRRTKRIISTTTYYIDRDRNEIPYIRKPYHKRPYGREPYHKKYPYNN